MTLEVFLGVAAALFGGLNIFQFIFLRSTRKEYAAKAEQALQEAKGVSAENESKAVDTLKEVIDELRADKAALRQDLAGRMNYIDLLKEDRQLAALHMCLHMGCAARRPESGKGSKWLEKHRDDIALDVDYLPLNMIIKHYGEKKEAYIEKAIKDD